MIDIRDISKGYLESNSGTFHKSLASAKSEGPSAYVYRVWRTGDEILERHLVYAYGSVCASIKSADESIERELKQRGIISEE